MELVLVLVGALLVTYGWYWGGVTESRNTGVAVGILAGILAGVTIFNTPGLDVAATASVGAVFGGIVAMTAMGDGMADRAQGLFALFGALVAVLTVAGLNQPAGSTFETDSLALVVLAVAYALVFISAGLVPGNRGFRSLVGWVVLLAGAVVAFLGYAPALEITLN